MYHTAVADTSDLFVLQVVRAVPDIRESLPG